jgi:hypothetical protein
MDIATTAIIASPTVPRKLVGLVALNYAVAVEKSGGAISKLFQIVPQKSFLSFRHSGPGQAALMEGTNEL